MFFIFLKIQSKLKLESFIKNWIKIFFLFFLNLKFLKSTCLCESILDNINTELNLQKPESNRPIEFYILLGVLSTTVFFLLYDFFVNLTNIPSINLENYKMIPIDSEWLKYFERIKNESGWDFIMEKIEFQNKNPADTPLNLAQKKVVAKYLARHNRPLIARHYLVGPNPVFGKHVQEKFLHDIREGDDINYITKMKGYKIVPIEGEEGMFYKSDVSIHNKDALSNDFNSLTEL